MDNGKLKIENGKIKGGYFIDPSVKGILMTEGLISEKDKERLRKDFIKYLRKRKKIKI